MTSRATGAVCGSAEAIQEREVGILQAQAQRVAVDDLDPGDGAIVVELAALECLVVQLVEAAKVVQEQPRVRRTIARVAQSLDRIGRIGCGELAPLAAERRIVRKVDAGLQPERIGAPTILRRGHGDGDAGHELRRTREIVELE